MHKSRVVVSSSFGASVFCPQDAKAKHTPSAKIDPVFFIIIPFKSGLYNGDFKRGCPLYSVLADRLVLASRGYFIGRSEVFEDCINRADPKGFGQCGVNTNFFAQVHVLIIRVSGHGDDMYTGPILATLPDF